MATSVDIAVILDRTSSTAFFHPTINSIVNHILGRATSVDGNDVRLASVEFQSHHDLLNVRTHPFTSATADTFAGWMSTPFVQGNGSPEHKAIDDAMSEALALQWRHHTKTSNLFHENLLILFTDGPPCGLRNEECSHQHRNLWKQAKKLLKKDITLVVVGIEPSILICDDFYCALASKTGGLYIPLINAARVLSTVVVNVMTTEQTFFQLFWRRNILENLEADSLFSYRAVEPRARSMIEHYRTMTAIRRSFYTYRERPASYFEVTSISIDVDARRSSWPLSPECLERSSYPSIEVTTSTPMTNDDGYHSRLPTTASDVCTPSQLDSPSEELHLNADTDTDDDDVFGCGPFIC